jgi:hypothetical protein
VRPIPAYWPPLVCAEETCLAAATWTVCDEPLRCTADFPCRELVSCDEHAETLAQAVGSMLAGNGRFTITPSAELYGGHD